MVFRPNNLAWAGLAVAIALLLRPASGSAGPVEFNRDIRPILSDACFHCHGFDVSTRKADLRLDTFEGATAAVDGRQAILPGAPDRSEVWHRITSRDPAKVMPPPASHKTLTSKQIEMVRQWISDGAAYQKHWAFEAPSRPVAPVVKQTVWPRNDIDRFLLANIEARGFGPSSPAQSEVLIRRVTLDLTGLPPTIEEVDAFLNDKDPAAFERVVERLFQSPRHGEHMARYWLDVARYGDTHGLHLDNERSMWPYRDWVVRAFNQNLPFDQFTLWQLAGDLLPNPTRDQLIASGFNRCNTSTSEGGAIDEEFQVRYAVDRVETASAAWLGLTMGCAVCHDHKLDPISQKEFFQVFSIFNNMDEKAMDGNALLPPPLLRLPGPDQEKQLQSMADQVTGLEAELKKLVSEIAYADPAADTNRVKPGRRDEVWIEDEAPDGASFKVNENNEPHRWVTSGEGPVLSGARSIRRSGKGSHQAYFAEASEPLVLWSGDLFFAYIHMDPQDLPRAVMLQFHKGEWKHRAVWGDLEAIPYGMKGTSERAHMGELPEAGKWVRLEVDLKKVGLKPGDKVDGLALTQFDGTAHWDKIGRATSADPAEDPRFSLAAWARAEKAKGKEGKTPDSIKSILALGLEARSAEQQSALRLHYLEVFYDDPASGLPAARKTLRQAREKRDKFENDLPATLISRELAKPRPAHVLIRGEYDKKGEPVEPGVPAVLPPLPRSEATNRLAFARWLVATNHPLTARVTVNRLWQQFFGVGLVKTAEDFGSKGEWPSNPQLLDWLATELIGSGWDLRHLMRLMVTSSAYRQDSRVQPRLLEQDPENRWVGRGPRFRMDAEMIRDNALFVSGLLKQRDGGRGVRPYQPVGIWEAVGYTTSNTAKYTQDTGDALYHRSLYLFWKRTAPPPSMSTFDAPSREQCRVRRERTNTPLQALLTLNDPQHFEAARHLGLRMMQTSGAADADRLRHGFRLCTARTPDDREMKILDQSLAFARAHYTRNPEEAAKAISAGESPVPKDVNAPELAAFTLVANLLLNLDEVLTRN